VARGSGEKTGFSDLPEDPKVNAQKGVGKGKNKVGVVELYHLGWSKGEGKTPLTSVAIAS